MKTILKRKNELPNIKQKSRKSILFYIKKDIYLYLLLTVPLVFYAIFKYIPMYGALIAFKDYNIFKGMANSEWVGLDVFKEIFRTKEFYNVLRNTLLLNFMDLLFGFPMPIILAIAMSEVKVKWFKKTIQTVGYLPYFLSWVVVGGILYQMFSTKSGVVNYVIKQFGAEAIPFLSDTSWWLFTYVLSGIWHGMGWGAILYMAAIAGINPELYEAAIVDGCNRLGRIRHITLPGIKPTITILMVLNLGKLVDIGFERPIAIGNVIVSQYSEVISTFVYRVGILSGRFSIATAIGLFQSLVGMIMIVTANRISKKLGGQGIW